jgi:hypothetical protein
MECRCWIYIAESFIQIGQRDKAQQAIDHAEPLATLPTVHPPILLTRLAP